VHLGKVGAKKKEQFMIEGVMIKPLTKIPDERGCIFPMIRSDNEAFPGLGEIYFSHIFSGSIIGWHLCKKAIESYAVVLGMIKLVLYDPRSNSKTKGEIQEIFLGDMKYALVQVPAGIWSGYKGISIPHSIVSICSHVPYDQTEILTLEPHSGDIPYKWEIRHG
jgi:dTDP-4-dehydrorhamnose 3,5-epimerase